VIVPQPVPLSTADVYREADRLRLPRRSLDGLRDRLLARGAGKLPPELLVNDLEPATLSLCPSVASALEALREARVDHAIVCGSGPTVAGLCWGADASGRARAIARELTRRFPATVQAVPVPSCGSGTMGQDR